MGNDKLIAHRHLFIFVSHRYVTSLNRSIFREFTIKSNAQIISHARTRNNTRQCIEIKREKVTKCEGKKRKTGVPLVRVNVHSFRGNCQ